MGAKISEEIMLPVQLLLILYCSMYLPRFHKNLMFISLI